jgi:phage replication O-like protein O
LESLMRIQLAPNEWSVLICIIRKTYGFQKKVDYIANFQIMQSTGLRKDTVSRSLRHLKESNLITKKGKVVGFNKDWESWQNCQFRPAEKLTNLPTKLAELSTKVDNPLVTQKKKQTIQKKRIFPDVDNINSILLKPEFSESDIQFLSNIKLDGGNQSLFRIVQILRGKQPAMEGNKTKYKAELESLGINYDAKYELEINAVLP